MSMAGRKVVRVSVDLIAEIIKNGTRDAIPVDGKRVPENARFVRGDALYGPNGAEELHLVYECDDWPEVDNTIYPLPEFSPIFTTESTPDGIAGSIG
jgi:hypothetical protein